MRTIGLDSIVETLKDWIMTALEYTVFLVLYYIEVALVWILSLVESLLEIFTGEKDVLYSGKSTTLVNVFFNHSSVRTIYTAIGLIGIVFAFAFAIVAVIRKVLDLRGKQQGVTLGTILGNLLKSILLIGGMNAIVLVALTTTNVLVEQVSYSFTHVYQLAQAKKHSFNEEEYAAMLRILNTVGNYSVNPSYRSRYNLNACYNDIRADLKYLGGKGVFDFHYVNEKDAHGNEVVTWQNLMESLGTAYNYNREVTLNSYDESLTKALLDAMEIIRVNPIRDNENTEFGKKYDFADIHSIEEYRKKVPVMIYDDFAPYLERMKNGEKNVLTEYSFDHMNTTSGTVGTPKYVPMTDRQMQVFMKYNFLYINGLKAELLSPEWMEGKIFCTSEGTCVRQDNGITVGCASAKNAEVLKGGESEQAKMMRAIYTSPVEAMIPEPGTDTKYLHMRFALMEENVTGITVGFYKYAGIFTAIYT